MCVCRTNGKKLELAKLNSCINLPYIIDGDTIVTQSNTCALYLGRSLKIDEDANFIHNHCVLDQTMDLRNDLMMIVYPVGVINGAVKTKEEFPAAAASHLEGPAKTHFTKLEGFCKGPYTCGDKIQSGVSLCLSILSVCPSIFFIHAYEHTY